MFLMGDDRRLVISASDLRTAAACEFALVRDLDIALEYETSPDEQGRAVSGKCEYKMC